MDVKEIYQIAYDPTLKTIADIHAAAAKLGIIRDQYQPGDPEHVACQEAIQSLTHYAVYLATQNPPAISDTPCTASIR